MDSQPVANWSAGAGLSAVLDTDAEMLNYVAPTMTPADFSPTGYLNTRESPVAIQLADWNHWLPTVYPGDAFGSAFFSNPAFTDYATILNMYGTPPASASTYKNVTISGPYWVTDLHVFFNNTKPAQSDPSWANPMTASSYNSLSLWQMVKYWEINQVYQLEGLSQAAFGPKAEPRAWSVNAAFQASPALNGIPQGAAGVLNGLGSSYELVSNAWYLTQLITNVGNPMLGCNNPLDFSYTNGTLTSLVTASNAPMAGLFLEILKKGPSDLGGYRVESTQVSCASGGFVPQDSNPFYALSNPVIWSGVSSSTRSTLVNNYMTEWVPLITSFTPTQWYQYVTSSKEEVYYSNPWANFSSAIAYVIPHAAFWGTSPAVINALEGWAATVWPASPYDQGGTFSWPATLTSACNTDSNGRVTCSVD